MTAIDATGMKPSRISRTHSMPLPDADSVWRPIAAFAPDGQAEFHRHVGAANILPNVDAALARRAELHRAIA
jgi:hypothetical protein